MSAMSADYYPECVVLASAALLVLAAIPIGREALDGPLTIGITVAALPPE